MLTGLETLHWDECESGLFAFYMKPCQPAQYPATPLHPLKITDRKSPYDNMHPLVKPTPQLQTSNNEHLSAKRTIDRTQHHEKTYIYAARLPQL